MTTLPPETPSIGEQVNGRYELIELLGSGGMGSVFRAIDHHGKNQVVALKLLNPGLTSNPRAGERFRNEVRIARQLHHPNIVRTHAFDVDQFGRLFIVMEYVSGSTLRTRDPRWTTRDIAQILRTLADALRCAHHERIIHRDLKPANVLMTPAGEPKISDFGIARFIDDDAGLTRTGEIAGSVAYMSPEQLLQRPLDERTDIYSLGIIGYELLAETSPHPTTSYYQIVRSVLDHDTPDLSQTNPEVPPFLADVIFRATHRNLGERYRRMEDLVEDLDRFLRSENAGTSRRRLSYRAKTQLRRELQKALQVAILFVFFLFIAARFSNPVALITGGPLLRLERTLGLKRSLLASAILQTPLSTARSELANHLTPEHQLAARVLLRSGADPHVLLADGTPVAFSVIEKHRVTLLDEMLRSGLNPNSIDESSGDSLLHRAARSLCAPCVMLLIREGADVNGATTTGDTPLLIAAKASANDIAAHLLAHHAAFDLPESESGKTPLSYALAAQNGPQINWYLAHGADPNHIDAVGSTPLITAAETGNSALVERLLLAGADPLLAVGDGARVIDRVPAPMRDMVSAFLTSEHHRVLPPRLPIDGSEIDAPGDTVDPPQ